MIPSLLSRGRLPSRDDSDDILTLFFPPGMRHEQNLDPEACGSIRVDKPRATHKSYGLPAFFTALVAVLDRKLSWVFKHDFCGVEADAVLSNVCAVFLLVPLESHTQIRSLYTYIFVRTRGRKKSLSILLAGCRKADTGPFLDRRAQIPGVAGEEHRDAVVVLGAARGVLDAEAVELGRVVGVEPARRLKGRAVESGREVVFGVEPRL